MARMPHLSALAMELSNKNASAAWAADEIAEAAWWAQIERLSIIPNREVGFFYPTEHVVAVVSRLRGGLKRLSVGVDSACVVAVAEAVLHCAAAVSVESIRFIWASLGEENARKAVELIIASKPPNLKSLVCSANVKDEQDPEYRKIVALATSAGISLANNVEGGLPMVVIEKL
ncbi:hypothetical protein DFJ73DRAFT_831387 [Zopfochytrium polystomum]|nr:hypothetical protein DFJ73DRAFT_831387 [Zopfochytrium polystomum]